MYSSLAVSIQVLIFRLSISDFAKSRTGKSPKLPEKKVGEHKVIIVFFYFFTLIQFSFIGGELAYFSLVLIFEMLALV